MGKCREGSVSPDATSAAMLARRNVSVPVFAGMIAASAVGIFLIPPLYVTFQGLRERLKPSSRPRPAAPEAEPAHKGVAAEQPPTERYVIDAFTRQIGALRRALGDGHAGNRYLVAIQIGGRPQSRHPEGEAKIR